MKVRRMNGKSIAVAGSLVLAAFFLAGCEDDSSANNEDVAALAARLANGETEEAALSAGDFDTATEDALDGISWLAKGRRSGGGNFPDGLHPSKSASKMMAQMFARHIKLRSDAGGNDPNVVACIGDSITKDYYARYLQQMVKFKVINAGKGGEGSASTAGRTSGVLSRYRPAYLCILTGANDISGADATPEQVAANVESCINQAIANNTIPLVGTLTPLSGSRAKWAADAEAASAAIREVVGRTGAVLVDFDKAF